MSDILSSNIEWPSPSAMTKMALPRTGGRPLVGVVALIGDGYSAGTGTTLHVHILRRQRGGYVVYREHRTVWEGAGNSYDAVLCDTPADVLAELGTDAMRAAESEAWSEAVRNDDALAALNQVDI